MRDHKQANEHSKNTTDEMEKETTPFVPERHGSSLMMPLSTSNQPNTNTVPKVAAGMIKRAMVPRMTMSIPRNSRSRAEDIAFEKQQMCGHISPSSGGWRFNSGMWGQ
jgi:hypothetical protein